MDRSLSLLVAALVAVSSLSPSSASGPSSAVSPSHTLADRMDVDVDVDVDVDADTGNWTVGSCIMTQFALQLTIQPNVTNANETVSIEVPRDATADASQSHCQNTTQELKLTWSDRAENGTDLLRRNFTIQFGRINNTAYGIRRAWGYFELAHFEVPNPKVNATPSVINVTSWIEVDTKDVPKLMFTVPFHYSFFCGDVGKWEFFSELHYDYPQGRPGIDLKNATVSAKNVIFDAFRDADAPHQQFQVPMDCAYQPNDIVPVAVGVTLAALVVIVLIAYLFGRRRARQRGYQSV